ncbi:MAG TPA: GAF domain-containing protein, partial [Acidimicrobiales bacterium]|nr:GAF domain-containing protein [Acidimicrobiales bacterium]
MERGSRPGAAVLLATATGSTAAGLWLQVASGSAMPAGFLQYAAVAVGTAALGSFILWHRPRNRYGLTHLAIGVLFGAVVLAAGVLARSGTAAALPTWTEEVALAWSWISAAALLPLWVIVIAAFPDARFHREVLRGATVALAIVMPFLAVVAYLLAPSGEPPPLIRVEVAADLVGPLAPAGDPHVLYRLASGCASLLGALAPVAAVVALIDRFRQAGPVLRQQIKWLLVGAAASVVLQAIPVQALDSEALRTAAQILVVTAVPLPLLAAAVAVFKHGLWEIDVVISKGLVYALVSGVLTALFSGVALVAGVSVGGRDSRVVTALGLALVVSFLAQPLRHRLETVAARILYGDGPGGLMALARLGDMAAPSLDARELGSRIADAARDALGVSWAGVWLYIGSGESGTLRPVAVSGAEPGPSAVLPRWLIAALVDVPGGARFIDLPAEVAEPLRPLFPHEPALVASLTSTGHLIGFLACGSRPKDPFGDEDVELLAVVARESTLALRNIRLEEELRQRLEEIEQQAAELHSSRQRLVTAQDRERKHIERDLHDGAQQRLVGLAGRLRRAARGDGATVDPALDELADEAEEAVFALQELARGIYPSLLADRGLPAAFQAHAARLPANVRVEVEPLVHGRRLEPELEAAFYFVGLEAVTNAVKHAPGARIIVSLRADEERRTVALEVHDDGPGCEVGAVTSSGGLQNMADRIDALGGVLSVESVLGGGTWIRAEVEEMAEVT